MQYVLYVFSLIFFKFQYYKDISSPRFLNKFQIDNTKVIRKKYRILSKSSVNKTINFDELASNYRPLFDAYEISENFKNQINGKNISEKNKNANHNIIPSFLNSGINSRFSLNKEKKTDKKDNLIKKNFDHYSIVTNSLELLNDIKVDASDLSKLSINNLSIPYNEQTKELFTHQRNIVISNKGNRKYKIVLMTKNPKFVRANNKYSNEKKTFIEKEENIEDLSDKNTNLYSGSGTLYFDNTSNDENIYNSIKEKHNQEKVIDNKKNTGRSVLKRILNFLSFRSDPHDNVSLLDETINKNNDNKENLNKESNALNNDNNNENFNKSPNDNLDNNNKNADISKLADQYLLNLKNIDSSWQELILVLRGELDLHSSHMKNLIVETKNKLESYIKKNFNQVDKISYDVSSPINFICFFFPNVFNMDNLSLLKEALTIIYDELKDYTESWNFSNSYVVDEVKEENFNKETKEKKYKKKKKKLYNVKYSFLRKYMSMDSLLSLFSRNKKKTEDIENEIFNFLPKELRNYSTWNLSVIRVFNAWFLAGYGNKNIKVCIIDSGVDLKHTDLIKNLYVPEYDEKYEMSEDFYDFMVKNPMDSSGHGTHVTGIIGGSANDFGVVGVSPNVKLISLRFIDGKKFGDSFHIIKALNVCIINKAPIINASWGSSRYDSSVHLAVKRLKNTLNGKGSIFVAAAGNKSKDNDIFPLYPSSFKLPHMLSVASISKNLELSLFSNYGANSVHIMAPGHHIYSTIPNNSYRMSTGTSMAAPHVCGVSALIYSVCHNQGFIPEAEDVIDILIRTSIRILSKEKKTIHESLVNAEAAVLTTLLGGLWMQIDCHFVKFYLDKGKKKHIPIVFSAYKEGIYETDIVIAIMPTDKSSNVYGEVHIPIKIVTNTKLPNFKESPRFGKNYVIGEDEATNDELLSFICENAIYNLQEYDINLIIISLVLLSVVFIFVLIGTIYFFKRKKKNNANDKNNEDFYKDQKDLNEFLKANNKEDKGITDKLANSINFINKKSKNNQNKDDGNQNEIFHFFQEVRPLIEGKEIKESPDESINSIDISNMFVE
ncbi:subtilisin-like protease 2, putative [Plasmodium relictum]|uniref:subtilisin n=1 Tax=Plasmodium relictum TaxID=85471 RepID=A0A1J1H6F1_PLARL|nr:subtilisin-like protease 2, putative [Plasmodium relictum]CRH00242.1 subtilisin-like protease 2, putative [Plasmodium relictum]